MMRAILFTALAALSGAAFAADGPEKAAVCAACHGATGVSQQTAYPTIAGQHANYLEHALKEYRSGARKNAIMGAQAKTLTDADIRALSQWFSRQESPLYAPKIGHRQD